mmetsp:Transcript_11098/g.39222  ORF Transcript_11098/g.39222 Transcript_11098/m.39222 type:complete len:464 (-) Transcript_11098:993-2384(-)
MIMDGILLKCSSPFTQERTCWFWLWVWGVTLPQLRTLARTPRGDVPPVDVETMSKGHVFCGSCFPSAVLHFVPQLTQRRPNQLLLGEVPAVAGFHDHATFLQVLQQISTPSPYPPGLANGGCRPQSLVELIIFAAFSIGVLLAVPNLHVVRQGEGVKQDAARPYVLGLLDQPNAARRLGVTIPPSAALEHQRVRHVVHDQRDVGVAHGLVDERGAVDTGAQALSVLCLVCATSDLEALLHNATDNCRIGRSTVVDHGPLALPEPVRVVVAVSHRQGELDPTLRGLYVILLPAPRDHVAPVVLNVVARLEVRGLQAALLTKCLAQAPEFVRRVGGGHAAGDGGRGGGALQRGLSAARRRRQLYHLRRAPSATTPGRGRRAADADRALLRGGRGRPLPGCRRRRRDHVEVRALDVDLAPVLCQSALPAACLFEEVAQLPLLAVHLGLGHESLEPERGPRLWLQGQ